MRGYFGGALERSAVTTPSRNSSREASDSSSATAFQPFSLFVKEGLAAAAQGQQFGFLHAVALDRRVVALPVEWAMALCHGAEEAVKKIETDAEVGVHVAATVHAAVMNVVEPSGP